MQKNCSLTGKSFEVTDWEIEHLKKFDAPLPDLCPEERHRRRLMHRNERRIYKRTCSLTGEPIVSVFSPDKPFVVYSQDAWNGDSWDGRDYGRDYDFSRPFFEQFYDLQKAVPHMALFNVNGENSEYCNVTTGNKNCYLVFGGDYCEDSIYSVFSMHCRDVSDLYWVNNGELLYDTLDSENCYNVKYSQRAFGCRDSNFLFECRNCENCTGCVGLVGKKYHIFNKAYSPEEYAKTVANMRLTSWGGVQWMKQEFKKYKLQFPHRFAQILNGENSTGDDLSNVKNVWNSFGMSGPAEDVKDVFLGGWGLKDAASCDHVGYKAELYYEMLGSIEGTHCAYCTFSWASQDTFYCDMVRNSHDLFGCSNLKRGEYCILNKQYSKEEYFALRERIVAHMKSTGEWGQFFPSNYSLFAYNETVAQDYFPLSKEQALAAGYRWMDEEVRPLTSAPAIPDSIEETTDAILKENLVCEKTGRPYRVIPQELAFYRKMGVPVPHYAPETRNELRIAMRNPIQTWPRQCAQCAKAIETSYAPNRPERVYCEQCYLAQVY